MDAATKEQLMAELRGVVRDAEELLKSAGESEAAREIDAQVRRNPWMAVGIAAGIGLLLGVLLTRK